jgi:uncharacterized protein (TIGR02217 family)
MAFHETQFPTGISLGSTGGPERRTLVVTTSSGYEHRNTQWAHSRHKYNAGYGVKTVDDLYEIIAFFEERRGKLHEFRWKDWSDYKSCAPNTATTMDDQYIGDGDGSETEFQLRKLYGSEYSPYERPIKKPVAGTVKISIDGVQTTAWSVDTTTGIITFNSAPADGAVIRAGFEFDVPVRFDTDYIEINLDDFRAGQIPDIPIIEVRI